MVQFLSKFRVKLVYCISKFVISDFIVADFRLVLRALHLDAMQEISQPVVFVLFIFEVVLKVAVDYTFELVSVKELALELLYSAPFIVNLVQ